MTWDTCHADIWSCQMPVDLTRYQVFSGHESRLCRGGVPASPRQFPWCQVTRANFCRGAVISVDGLQISVISTNEN